VPGVPVIVGEFIKMILAGVQKSGNGYVGGKRGLGEGMSLLLKTILEIGRNRGRFEEPTYRESS
jgi:hypothetical protein